MFRSFEEEYEEKEAFRIYDGSGIRRIRYREFLSDILRAANYFVRNSIEGRHVALLLGNSYEWYVAFYAVLASGNVVVLINRELPEEEISRQCEKADVAYVISGEDPGGRCRILWSELTGTSGISLDEVRDCGGERLACLLFTSGTLGSSKAIMLTADNLDAGMANIMENFQMSSIMLILPLYHISGVRYSLAVLAHGKTVCIGRGIKYIFQDMPVLNPDHMTMVPGIMESLVKILKRNPLPEQRKRYIGENLKYLGVGGAASREDTCLYMLEQGFVLGTGYGLSETTGCGMSGYLSKENVRTLGKLEHGMSCRIEDGELLLAGPAVMAGYYKEPEATGQAIRNGWLYTGDIGYRDEDGNYYLTGRKKNVIILSNGENVSPEEVEEKLGRCSQILECMVYGDVKGICADIYAQDRERAEQYVKEYNQSVPTYRQIYKAYYFDCPLEKTGSGKIRRKRN